MMYRMRFLLFLFMLGSSLSVSAQSGGYAVYEDIQGFFYVFDNGIVKQLEGLKVKEYKVARNYVAYVNNQSQFKLYDKGYNKTLAENLPEFFTTTDYLLVFGVGGNLYVYEDKRAQQVASFVKQYVAGDSIVAFNNLNDNFTAYYKGRSRTLEVFAVTGLQAGKNILAYLDNMEQFQAYLYGQKYQLDNNPPKEYKCGRNTIAYVDFYGRFKIFYKGEIIEADPFSPKSYQVGDNMVAYINRNGQFMVFDDGIITEIESQPPMEYELNDAIIAYSLPSRQFKAYYKGETFVLESYIPESYKIDNELLVWPDYMNYLKALDHGEIVKATNRIQQGYELWLDVVVSDVGKGVPQIFHKGKFY
ncbi:MAG: hypothetical protein IPN95_02300 [Bacteroidetes bacterium]|nr:hypothetical protein [Bacteroidota bacterium]